MIVVHNVVAVHDISAEEISPMPVELNLISRRQFDDILASVEHGVGLYRLAVLFDDLEFLEMCMDRMRPVVAAIPNGPDFGVVR